MNSYQMLFLKKSLCSQCIHHYSNVTKCKLTLELFTKYVTWTKLYGKYPNNLFTLKIKLAYRP